MSIKISELPETTAIGNDDLLAIVQEGSTKKITFGNAIGKAQQIIEISRNVSTYYHLDEDFTVQGSLPLEEGIYYNNTKQTLGTIRIVTGFSDNTFTYTTLPYGSYLIVYPVQVYTPSLDITHRYYKLLVITRGTASVSGPYADNLVHIKSYMVTASVGDFFNTMTCVESEFENDANAVYETLAEKQAEIDQLYDQIPTATATGETINVQDSSNLPIKDFAMLGNATQVTTTGKQLLDINNLNYGFSNVASSYNNLSTIEKGIRYNSTFNSGTPIVMFKIIDLNNYIGKTVRMKSNFTTKGEIRLGTANSDLTSRTQKASTYTSGTEISFTVTNDMGNNHYLTYALAIRGIASTGDTVDFTNLVITIDNADMTYEPYTGGKASPNPDYPQDIHVVTGDNTLKVVGKNLFDISVQPMIRYTNYYTYSTSGNTMTAHCSYSNTPNPIGWNIPVKVGGDVTISYSSLSFTKDSGTNNQFNLRYAFSDVPISDVTSDTTNSLELTNLINTTSEFTKTNEHYVIAASKRFLILIVQLKSISSFTLSNLQIENNSTNTSFEPYTEQTQLLSLGSIELAKIGDYTDRIFKSGDKWYKQGNIGKYVVNEQTSLQKRNTSANNTYTYSFNIAFEYKIEASQTGNTLCNYFTHLKTVPGVTTMYNELLDVIGISLYYNSNSPNSRGIYINTNVELTTAWLTAHNIPIYYVLATPTTTEITDETLLAQLENVLKMHTNKNVTNASIEPSGSNAQAGLALTYRQDLETMFSNISNG